MARPPHHPVHRPETRLAHAALAPFAHHGIVNPPVYHASTVLFPTLAALQEADRHPYDIVNYGRVGTPTSQALEDAVAELEGGYRAICTASGLNAICTALMAFTRGGDHVLVTDSAYGPTRRFCDEVLRGYGVAVEYYDPRIGAGISGLLRPNTRVLYLESPGSLTFEMQDVPAMAAAARAAGVTVLMDNTWATPLYFQPLRHGVDVVIHAATKYIVGHSDAMLGLLVCNEASFTRVKRVAVWSGTAAGPDDVYLGLRGLRSLAPRLARHQENALVLARWLEARPEVTRVLHPALPRDPGHALWQRDFSGASGLFAFELQPSPPKAVAALVEGRRLFGLGYSWGGFESLILPARIAHSRTATPDSTPGPLIRLHAGLEAVEDLIADLEEGLDAWSKACS